ncbi:hypothetical protein [Agrobacterium larrymoorei]|uniref:DUF805 domain-containing protein n=1 Tax=Agrobacterium larrymoorei TaxID=160699 RepID=A0A4D7DVL9_9HYPH|nr:hypothetical protein [Agrobacterium larrymoorei]QCI98282.1 hypothetical protein CFBP5473_10395 [Agrobacterium larrymoorei]QYA06264.1 hypothetical protein J5285_09330 [Agrobacterium larrymoorei]
MSKVVAPPDVIGSQQKRRVHLVRALRIAAAISLGVVAMVYVMEFDGSMLFLIGADFLLLIACGPTMLRSLRVWDAIANGAEGILPLLLLGVLIMLLPVVAVVFLVIELSEAAFTRSQNEACSGNSQL